jgi:membrane protease YdiL (CAAX protease family)
MFTRRLFLSLSLFTLIAFSVIGALCIVWWQNRSLASAFVGSWWLWQLLYGTAYGVATSLIAISIVEMRSLQSVTDFFRQIFSKSELKFGDIVFASFCAGVGEELLFRGGLQPFLGIWLTAIVFIAIHGYLDPRNWRLFIYGVLMVFMSAGLGYLCDNIGIISAMMAHAIFDLVMFSHLLYNKKTNF